LKIVSDNVYDLKCVALIELNNLTNAVEFLDESYLVNLHYLHGLSRHDPV